MSTTTDDVAPRSAFGREVAIWTLGVVVAGLLLPGGGLLLALVAFFTRLRHRRTARVALVVVGAVLVALDVGLYSLSGTSVSVGTPHRV